MKGPIDSDATRVLYIDDDEALVWLATRALTKFAMRVKGYSDPGMALEHFTAHADEFDVVVTDISMPRMSGAEVAQRIRSIRPGIPIIMTSGCLRPEDYRIAQRLQINRLVCKPSTMVEFATLLASEVDRARSCDEAYAGHGATAEGKRVPLRPATRVSLQPD